MLPGANIIEWLFWLPGLHNDVACVANAAGHHLRLWPSPTEMFEKHFVQ